MAILTRTLESADPQATKAPEGGDGSGRPAGSEPEAAGCPERFDIGVDWEALAPTGIYARRGRRALDLVLLGFGTPIALPVLLLIGCVNLVLYRDPRKILFVQERVGWRGRVFRMYKFRTMRDVPESALASWSNGSDRLRVTPFGRFLRNMHLDELPQLYNVLRGEMGIIGPRPEMIEIEAWAGRCIPGFTRRLCIRPGITGLAQVTQGYTGRSVEAYSRKLAITERYLRDLRFGTDLSILLRTAAWMLRGRGWRWRDGANGSATTTR